MKTEYSQSLLTEGGNLAGNAYCYNSGWSYES